LIVVISQDRRDALRVAAALGHYHRALRGNGHPGLPDALRIPVTHAHPDTSRPDTTRLDRDAPLPEPAPVPVLLLTYSEAARRLNASERTVQRLVAAGSLAARRIGRRSYVTPADLEAFVAGLPIENRTSA
jgi:excisionase family DNA binding protein